MDTLVTSRCKIANAIAVAGVEGAETLVVDGNVAFYAEGLGDTYRIIFRFPDVFGRDLGAALVELAEPERAATGYLVRFRNTAPLEPEEGPGSVTRTGGGFLAVSGAGTPMELEDEVAAWNFAASEVY